jgi:hypothetical protein
VNAGSTAYVGPDAVSLFRAITLRSGLRLYRATGLKPNRSYTPTAMLTVASEYTGRRYKRGQFEQAENDLTVWIETMKAAMPIVRE